MIAMVNRKIIREYRTPRSMTVSEEEKHPQETLDDQKASDR